ncbi:DUF2931 family protein [Chryseobacterium arachidis]|nr:DUF2931 family protein [Chryseobacterium arachidis]
MEEKYSWLGTVSAPQEYPMEVYSGAIIADDFTYGFDAIWGTQNTGWGNEGGTMNVQSKKMQIPHALEFTWYSLIEKKFYTGKWKLDQEKIEKLFKDGFLDSDTGKKETYRSFKIGLAPKGKLSLWINAPGVQKEIAFFQAHDTIITKDKAYENAQYMLEKDYADERLKSDFLWSSDVKNRISTSGYPDPSVYEKYRKKYFWKPIVELPEGYQVKKIFYMACNGEADTYKVSAKELAIPYYLSLVIVNPQGKQMGTNIFFTKDQEYYSNNILKGNNVLPADFDLMDINTVFNTIDPKQEADFIMTIDPEKKSTKIDLKQDNKTVALKDFISKIY